MAQDDDVQQTGAQDDTVDTGGAAPAEIEAVLSGEGAAHKEWDGVKMLTGEERYAFR